MKNLNKITLIGNLGKDPEIRTLEGDVKVAKISLATTETYKDTQGQTHTHTEWHNIVLWRSLAQLAEQYMRKGSTIYLEGKNRTRSYTDNSGIQRYTTEIIGENIILLDKKDPE